MALSLKMPVDQRALEGSGQRVEFSGERNDAFSFWKLPEQWRAALEPTIGASETAAERLLLEQYLPEVDRHPPSAMRAYYCVKRLIPRRLRHRLNSAAIRARTRLEFPSWPCESALVELWRDWVKRSLELYGAQDGWHIGFWPDRAKCCIVLTHDVESPKGFDRIEALAEIEERHGFRSAWNLPLAQYPIDWQHVARLRARGFEFGAHGLSHDGRLFRSHRDFAELAPVLERLAAEHGLRGFRAPSTLRDPRAIATMDFDFDSSFADTDPYEPQPGGTCSLFPFHLSRLVELPYTLPQDHTLIHLLRRSPLPVWTMKAKWIASLGGMILTLTHPDYCGDGVYLESYRELLKRLGEIDTAWRALPSEVAVWWKQRAQLQLQVENNRPSITGPGASRATALRLSEQPLVR
jgi:peptidoglycan/xylan/chitin deacetylase (PgdA/CDA1 family)